MQLENLWYDRVTLLIRVNIDTDSLIQAKGSIDQQIQVSMLIVRIHILDVHHHLIISAATLHPLQRKMVSDLLSHSH